MSQSIQAETTWNSLTLEERYPFSNNSLSLEYIMAYVNCLGRPNSDKTGIGMFILKRLGNAGSNSSVNQSKMEQSGQNEKIQFESQVFNDSRILKANYNLDVMMTRNQTNSQKSFNLRPDICFKRSKLFYFHVIHVKKKRDILMSSEVESTLVQISESKTYKPDILCI